VEGVYPAIGPQSGGTQLAVTGRYLNIGSTVEAWLDNLPCTVNTSQVSGTRLTCVTSRAPAPGPVLNISLKIDNATRVLSGNPFNYTQDPTIMEIKPLKSFASGGRMITVHGTNLDTVQNPEMVVYDIEHRMIINKSVSTKGSPAYI